MLIKRPPDIRGSEITDKSVYLNRRQFIRAAAGGVAGLATAALADEKFLAASATPAPHGRKLDNVRKSPLSTGEPMNTWEQITTYNNYYEFGIDKDLPSQYARQLKTDPWTVTVDGECNKKAAYHLEDVLKGVTLEERIYRHRCVEAWSMVIPWIGFPLGDFIKRCEPTSKAKYVEFTTLYDPKTMPGVRSDVLDWPYVEGLRMDEAMHPLTILGVGLYGEVLPNQNGAPIRLHVPWKYGFKSIKSIVKIKFVEKQPLGSWQKQNPDWYGFYSNVNPDVSPVRWNQSRERRLPSLFTNRKTELFNGYGDQVASMYSGLDLRKYY